jgi:8-oxo-dGTP pyrophosphatase MutT (NUDIX family)
MHDSRIDLLALRRAFRLPEFDPVAAQAAMEPAFRGPPPPDAGERPPREGAALAYLFEGRAEGQVLLPLTLRRDDLKEHRGQVSLPGGRPEPGESLRDAALREAREELGIRGEEAEPLGSLAPVYIPVTHTRLTVLVVYGPDPRPLTAEPAEVARATCVPLGALLEPARRRRCDRTIRGRVVDVPSFGLEGLDVWGATAMALSELAERIRAAGDSPVPPSITEGTRSVSPG